MVDLDIRQIAVGFLAILMSVTLHEFAHAWVADRMGDPTPGRHGRLTLNPIVLMQAHPIGVLVAPLIGAWNGFLIGWAATPVSYSQVHRRYTIRQAALYISAAGPASNLALALLSAAALVLAVTQIGVTGGVEPIVMLLDSLVRCNVLLAVFNMLPIPPLDGFTVLRSLVKGGNQKVTSFLSQYSTILFILILLQGDVLFRPIFRGVYFLLGAAIALAGGPA